MQVIQKRKSNWSDVGRGGCNEHGTIYAISSDFGDRMTTQHLD